MLDNPWIAFISNHITELLYGGYVGLFVLLCVLEYLVPRRLPTQSRWRRWFTNLSIFSINSVISLPLSTLTLTNLAYFTWKNHWGLLNLLPLSPLAQFGLTLLMLDLVAYTQHRTFHKISLAWRFHRVHHLDLDLDASSGLLFHPLEAFFSFLIRQPLILLLGFSPLAIIVFDVSVVIFDLLTHANLRIPAAVDKVLRLVFVTPDMHRIHHSTDWEESNSNFGFSLSVWDRFLGTYRAQPGLAPEKMRLGLEEFQSPRNLRLLRLLAFPFVKKKDSLEAGTVGIQAGQTQV